MMVETRFAEQQPVRDDFADRVSVIGQYLRDTRIAKDEGLDAIAERLRIRRCFLEAIEEGRWDRMPGRTYALGFLRSYCDALGFDGRAIVEDLKGSTKGGLEQTKLEYRTPLSEHRLPSGPVIAASILLAAVAYGSWLTARHSDGEVFSQVRTIPGTIGQYTSDLFEESERRNGLADAGDNAATFPARPQSAGVDTGTSAQPEGYETLAERRVAEAIEQLTAEEPLRSALDARAETLTARDGDLLRSRAASQALAELRLEAEPENGGGAEVLLAELVRRNGEPEREARHLGVPAEQARVVLVARADSWIQVQSDRRDYFRSMTLEKGDRLALPDRDDLTLWTGNAGGLDVVVDGINLGDLGEPGAVLQDVALAPPALSDRLRP